MNIYQLEHLTAEWDDEPANPYYRIQEIEIIHGHSDLWITFKDTTDCDEGFRGRVYRNPTMSSLHRLAKATYYLPVDLVVDGKSFIVNILLGDNHNEAVP